MDKHGKVVGAALAGMDTAPRADVPDEFISALGDLLNAVESVSEKNRRLKEIMGVEKGGGA